MELVFFSFVELAWGWDFVLWHFYWNVCKWIPNAFSVGMWLFLSLSYLLGPKFGRNGKVCFPFNDFKSFRRVVVGVFSSVLQICPYFWAMAHSKLDWWSWSKQKFYVLCLCVFQSIFLAISVIQFFDYLWKPKTLFLRFFNANCLLKFHSTYGSSCFWKIFIEPT